jgi:hypothetical protein
LFVPPASRARRGPDDDGDHRFVAACQGSAGSLAEDLH